MIETLDGVANFPKDLSEKEKLTMISKALNAIIMCFGDKALREISKDIRLTPKLTRKLAHVKDKVLITIALF